MGVKYDGLGDVLEELASVSFDTAAELMTRIDKRIQKQNPRKTGNMVNSWVASRTSASGGNGSPKTVQNTSSARKKRVQAGLPQNAWPMSASARTKFNTTALFLVNSVPYADKIWINADSFSKKATPMWGDVIVSSEVARTNR